jgi:predicted nucleic acid-binding protein
MIYFDTSYLARLYLEDPGWEKVRTLAATDHLACCLHGRAEAIAAFHRKLREGVLTPAQFRDLLDQFETDCDEGAYRWLVLSEAVLARLTKAYVALPKTASLRAADAIHLACAAENAFKQVHSNDQRLLSAASHFGLKGVNVI